MKISHLLLALGLGLSSTALLAQKPLQLPDRGKIIDGKTIVKLSPYHLLSSGLGVEVERTKSRRISTGIGIYYIPRRSRFWYASPNTPGLYSSSVSTLMVEPESKYYFNQGFGRGFYTQIGLAYTLNLARNFSLYLEDSDKRALEREMSRARTYYPGPPSNQFIDALRFEGETHSLGGSLSLGYQTFLGKGRNISLDFYVGARADLMYSTYEGKMKESLLENIPSRDRGLTEQERKEVNLGAIGYTRSSSIFPVPFSRPQIVWGEDNRSASFRVFGYRWFPNMGFTIGFRF